MNPKIESVLEKLTELVALARTKYTKPTNGIPASDLSSAVNQSLNKANSAVQDSGYVHTDNNFSTPEKTKLAGLQNYDDTEIKSDIESLKSGKANASEVYTKTQTDNNFVAKVTGKGLSTNDYTTAEKNKLTSSFNFAGEVNSYEQLPEVADYGTVYHVVNKGYYAFLRSGDFGVWIPFGNSFNINEESEVYINYLPSGITVTTSATKIIDDNSDKELSVENSIAVIISNSTDEYTVIDGNKVYLLSTNDTEWGNGNLVATEERTKQLITAFNLTNAEAGKFIKIKSVDSNGIPTEWETADGYDDTKIKSDINRIDDKIGNYIKKTRTTGGFEPFDFSIVSGATYKITNLSSTTLSNVSFIDSEGNSTRVVTSMKGGNSLTYTADKNYPKVTSYGNAGITFEIVKVNSLSEEILNIDKRTDEVKNSVDDAVLTAETTDAKIGTIADLQATVDGWNTVSYPLVKNVEYVILNTTPTEKNIRNLHYLDADGNQIYIQSGDLKPFEWVKFTPTLSVNSFKFYGDSDRTLRIFPTNSINAKSNEQESYVDIYSLKNCNLAIASGRVNCTDGSIEPSSTGDNRHVTITNLKEKDIIHFHSCTAGNGSTYGYAFYDIDGNYISGFGIYQEEDIDLLVPENAVTWRYGFHVGDSTQTGWINNWHKERYTTFKVIQSNNLSQIIKLVENSVTDLSAFSWNAVGDSITELASRYRSVVTSLIKLNSTNCGVGSTTIAINNSRPETQNLSFVERVCGLNGNTPYPDADIWTINGGVNDCARNSTLGTLQPFGSNFDLTTVYGALQKMCEHILSLKANQNLLLITPIHGKHDTDTSSQTNATMKQIHDAFIEVGAYYGVPVLDTWNCGISHFNCQRNVNPTTTDGIHPNELGAYMLGKYIANGIEDLMKFVKKEIE